MKKDLDFETYLSISSKKFEIFLFDKKNFKNIYFQDHKNQFSKGDIDLGNLSIFLKKNVFNIEKLIGKFLKNINLIIENDNILNLNIGIKKKNYEQKINKKILETTLVEVKDLFNKNYQNYKIMHMSINRYLINENIYSEFKDDLNCKNFSIEVQFISIPNNFAFDIEKVLEEFQIKVTSYLNKNYIENLFNNHNLELPIMAHKTKLGFNVNEVVIVPKNTGKKGLFEKFFQLFG